MTNDAGRRRDVMICCSKFFFAQGEVSGSYPDRPNPGTRASADCTWLRRAIAGILGKLSRPTTAGCVVENAVVGELGIGGSSWKELWEE
jgi:hypothetical protein